MCNHDHELFHEASLHAWFNSSFVCMQMQVQSAMRLANLKPVQQQQQSSAQQMLAMMSGLYQRMMAQMTKPLWMQRNSQRSLTVSMSRSAAVCPCVYPGVSETSCCASQKSTYVQLILAAERFTQLNDIVTSAAGRRGGRGRRSCRRCRSTVGRAAGTVWPQNRQRWQKTAYFGWGNPECSRSRGQPDFAKSRCGTWSTDALGMLAHMNSVPADTRSFRLAFSVCMWMVLFATCCMPPCHELSGRHWRPACSGYECSCQRHRSGSRAASMCRDAESSTCS